MEVKKEETVLQKAQNQKARLLRNIAEAEAYFDALHAQDPFREAVQLTVKALKGSVDVCDKVIDLGTRDPGGIPEAVAYVENVKEAGNCMTALFDRLKAAVNGNRNCTYRHVR